MITIETAAPLQATDVTDLVLADAPQISEGLLIISCPHTSAAVFLCEADDELLTDFAEFSGKWLAAFEPFHHVRNDNPNAAAHITSSMFGGQVIVPVFDGKPQLGTYQRVVFLELDGPKRRSLQVLAVATPVLGRAS